MPTSLSNTRAGQEGESGKSNLQRRWYGLNYAWRKPAVVVIHGWLFSLALFAAFLLAYNFRYALRWPDGTRGWFIDLYLPLLTLSLPIKLVMFHWLDQYQSTWRYASLRDLFGVIRAALLASFGFVVLYFLLENTWDEFYFDRLIDEGRPSLRQSVFLLDWSATIVFVSAAKVLVRFYYEDIQPQEPEQSIRTLIVGAGDAGETLVRQLRRTRRERHVCVGFLDDQVAQLYGRIHDVQIMGRTSDIRAVCQAQRIEEVFVALPQVSPRTIRHMVEQCEGLGIRFRTVPAMTDVIEGRVQVSQIRDVEITDLLGRDPVQLDVEQIGRDLRGKRVLVTGAGGSIGSEMCRQIAAFEPQRLILVEQAENNLFEIQREVAGRWPKIDVVPCIADIIDGVRIESIFTEHQPSVVFHAAAHKHVPLMEDNPGEAIKNNVRGTMVVADAAIAGGVRKMVMISTDKAVNPTSVMGCTKRVAELYVQSRNGTDVTQFVTVRFGNVLGSSGSVVPIFREQIRNGGPVTVTHPEMKRYFMTIPEAAQLVLQAGTMGRGGEIFLLHMGEPVRIVDLARDMITLSGLRPGVDIDIVFTGVRPGEKLFEELSAIGEHVQDTNHPKIGIWKHREHDGDRLRGLIDDLIDSADSAPPDALRAKMRAIVPEFAPAATEAASAPVGVEG